MNICVAISHKEKPTARIWAHWLVALGLPEGTKIFLTFDQKVDEDTYAEVYHGLASKLDVDVEIYFGEDPGYPGGSNRMFVFTARRAAKEGKPFLWMETDMIPLRLGWFEEVMDEYERLGKPYMGSEQHKFETPHINGTAVYPADWESTSDIALCPDHWPWDTYGRFSISNKGKASASTTIKHTYKNKTFPRDTEVLGECSVFHPCKDASLIKMLNDELQLLDDSEFDCEPLYVLVQGSGDLGGGYLNEIGAVHLTKMMGIHCSIAVLDTISKKNLAFRKLHFDIISKKEYQHYQKYQ